MLGISVALNALSVHGACTAVFVAVAAIAGGSLASIQTFGKISWLAWVGVVCILSASKSRCDYRLHQITDVLSFHSYGRCRCRGQTFGRTEGWCIQVGLEARREP